MTQLLSLLDDIKESSQQLLDCLTAEKKALDDRDYEELIPLTQTKQQLLNKLEELELQRKVITPEQGISEYLTTNNNPSLMSQWNNTRNLIAQCQQQNEINGRLLNRQSKLCNETIALMTGKPLDSHQVYAADGSQTKNTQLLNNIEV